MAAGGVVFQFKAVADKAKRDVLDFASSLTKVDTEADRADRELGTLDTAIDNVGDAAQHAKGDVDKLGDELTLADFDGVSAEAEEAARKLRIAAGNMAGAVHTGAVGIDRETDQMKADLGEAGRESGAEFIGNVAEGIGSGQMNLNDVVSGTLGGITNLAATLTGPLGLAVGAAAAGVGLVFAAVKGQSEQAKARVDELIGALEEVGTTSGKAARAAIWDTWLTKMKENRGTLDGIVANLRIAGIDQGTFKAAITGSAAEQKKVRDQLFLTGQELIQNKQHGKELTDEQEAYLENFPEILSQLSDMNGDLDESQGYFDDLDWLSGKTKDNVDKTGKSIDKAGEKARDLGDDLDDATKDQNVKVTWTIAEPKLKNGRVIGGGSWDQNVVLTPSGVVAGPAAFAPVTNVTINVEGATDPYSTARIIERQLAQYARIQGRTSPAAAVAW